MRSKAALPVANKPSPWDVDLCNMHMHIDICTYVCVEYSACMKWMIMAVLANICAQIQTQEYIDEYNVVQRVH